MATFKLEVTTDGTSLLQTIYDMIGNDFDSLGEFTKALVLYGSIGIDGDVDDLHVAAEASDEWIERQYKERFDVGDYRDFRDEVAGVGALASGNKPIARALFDRAGREDLARAF